MTAVAKLIDSAVADAPVALTDGFPLVIDALKLNGIETIYNVPGIPITDLGRLAQGARARAMRAMRAGRGRRDPCGEGLRTRPRVAGDAAARGEPG